MRSVAYLTAIIPTLMLSCTKPPANEIVELSEIDPSNLPFTLRYASRLWSGAAVDIDNDGVSERLDVEMEVTGNLAWKIYYLNGGVFQQHNVAGGRVVGHRDPYYIADFDSDNKAEYFVSFVRRDSTFLRLLDDDFQTVLREFLIASKSSSTFPQGGASADYMILAKPQMLYDYNKDGRKDLYCNYLTQYELQPRGIFVLDLESSEILDSYAMANNPVTLQFTGRRSIWFEDFNGDGDPEVIPASIYAVDNGARASGFADSLSYLIILDTYLKPLWVEEFGSRFSRVVNYPFQTPEGKFLLTLFASNVRRDAIPPRLILYDLSNLSRYDAPENILKSKSR